MIVLFNKPYLVLCQFTDQQGRPTLSDYVPIKDIYAAGRLDRDSEGLLVLTNDGRLQSRITEPRYKLSKTYWAQVEGDISDSSLDRLATGIKLNDGMTQPAVVKRIETPLQLWERSPPVRFRKTITTQWLSITLHEGRNRQVRRMTAAVGHPLLRLIRYRVGSWTLDGLVPGGWRSVEK